ncbi:MAG: hypothetical protein AAGI88_02500 [Pseudomonadota bacterium]
MTQKNRRTFFVDVSTFLVATAMCVNRSAHAQWPPGAPRKSTPERDGASEQYSSNSDGYSVPDGPSEVGGCTYLRSSAIKLSDIGEIVSSLGDSRIDQLAEAEARVLSSAFRVRPALGFIREAGAPNAFATNKRVFEDRPGNGTVLLGQKMVSSNILQHRNDFSRWGTAVMLVMAHEWGHILQFQTMKSFGNPLDELIADFMAGWYLAGKSQLGARVEYRVAGEEIYSIGDFAFNSPDHHGTPAQRLAALNAGGSASFGNPNLNSSQALSLAVRALAR